MNKEVIPFLCHPERCEKLEKWVLKIGGE